MSFREKLSSFLQSEDLLLLGIVRLGQEKDFARFEKWLSHGKEAGMNYLHEHLELRQDPRGVFPGAQSAVVFALPYDGGDAALDSRGAQWTTPRVAQYARFDDYHKILRKKGTAVLEKLKVLFPEIEGRVTVDSAPILERALAARTSQGFIGKNTCYIHPTHGSLLLLGEILTNFRGDTDSEAEIDPHRHTTEGGCGICDRCQVHCPTGALDESYSIDSNLCLSYWTIEHRGAIPEKFWPWMKLYYFGCDLCQLACPYNKKETTARLPSSLKAREYPPLFETATMDQASYEKYFGGTPLTRAKRNGLRRNALIAMTVTEDPRLNEAMLIAEKDAASPIAETLTQIRTYRVNP